MPELVTLEQFAGYVKQDLNDADAYTAELLLDGAEDAVRQYCGWHIAPPRTETVTVDGSGSVLLELPTMHLTDVDAITENGDTVDVDDAYWGDNGILERNTGGWWTARRRGVTVTITHGYTITPAWLVTLICAAAGRAFRAPVGVASEAAGGESVTWAQVAPGTAGAVLLLEQECHMLDRLRVPRAA